jgi:hypothetical protein
LLTYSSTGEDCINRGAPQTLDVIGHKPVHTARYINATIPPSANAAANSSARDDDQESFPARTSNEPSLAIIPTNNNDTSANASTRDYQDKSVVDFILTTNKETTSMNTDNVGQAEESNLDSNRLFPSNTGVLTTLLQTQNFDNNTRTLLNILIRSINNANASTRDDHTSDINGQEVVNTTKESNATEPPSTNNTPVNDVNSGNASGRDDQSNGGALETFNVNKDGTVDSTGNNSATKQPSANDPPVNNATAANGDDGYHGDVPPTNIPPDNNATAANASVRDHQNNGSAQETFDVDGYKQVHTSGNFDATKQLPADYRPVDNGTATNSSARDYQQESSFGTTSVEPSLANNPPTQ